MSTSELTDENAQLLDDLVAGNHRSLARTISKIENRAPGYRALVSELYAHGGNAEVIGITGSPGAGKSTLVDKLAEKYRERGETVGIIAIDPSSPFTGGAVLGDRIRMASTVGDMDVFVRSMSARGTLGGLSTATADAVKAMDAFGKDKIIIETVGAGQNEIDIVRTADTVAVLVPPGSGDAIQTLKAGILEIADVFVVNKADRPGADRTVQELMEMVELGAGSGFATENTGHHGPDAINSHPVAGDGESSDVAGDGESSDVAGDGESSDVAGDGESSDVAGDGESSDVAGDGESVGSAGGDDPHGSHIDGRGWVPPIVETVATKSTGIEDLVENLDSHRTYLESTGELESRTRRRYAEEIRTLLREDVHALLEVELERHGGIDDLAEAVRTGDADPYSIAATALDPVESCLDELDPDD